MPGNGHAGCGKRPGETGRPTRPEPRPGPTSPPTKAPLMSAFIDTHGQWLTVARLPAYAPDLNPVEGAWSNMKNSLGNLGSCSTPRQLAAIVKNRLKRIQYRPALIDGFLAQTQDS